MKDAFGSPSFFIRSPPQNKNLAASAARLGLPLRVAATEQCASCDLAELMGLDLFDQSSMATPQWLHFFDFFLVDFPTKND